MKPVRALLEADHARLAQLLERSVRGAAVDAAAFHEFRAGLLRHIGMEEKTLLPLAKRLRGGRALEEARQLKLDHSALAALLVPTPTPAIVGRIARLLEAHNRLEEGELGVYARCEELAGAGAESLAAELDRAPPVKLAPHNDAPLAFEAIERQLRAAGRA